MATALVSSFRAATVVLFAVFASAIIPRVATGQSSSQRISCTTAPDAEAIPAIFSRWINDVWLAGRVDLVPELIGVTYVRHEAGETRTVTSAQYAEEIAATRRRMPGVRFIVHDCAAVGDRLWTRWTMVGTSSQSGQRVRRMATQIYRVADGRLVETWMLMLPDDAAWPEQQDSTRSR